MTISAPADKRFRRPSVRPAQRRRFPLVVRWRAVRLGMVLLIVLYGGYQAATLLIAAGAFRVNRITVRGNVRLSTGEVLALISGLKQQSVLTADLPTYQAQLEESPWVASAALRRVLPSGVDVAIRERTPMGLCRIAGRLYLVDGTGRIIDDYGPQHADLDLPIIDGLAGAPRAGAPSIDPARAELASRVMQSIATRKGLARRVSQIDVSDAQNAVVILGGDMALLHLGDDHFAERLLSYLELAPALRARLPEIDYVDLRFDERVYVRPAGPAGQGPRPAARRGQAGTRE
jgi:cell division protein FtsQ